MKALTNPDNTLKSRDITLPTKVHIVKAMVFPVVMYGCWTIKKTECQRTDDFKLWCWRRFLSLLDCKEIKAVNSKGNQAWIFTWEDWGWHWGSNTLAMGCKEATHWKRHWCWERLKAKGEVAKNELASLTQWTWIEKSLGDSGGQRSLVCYSPWGHKESVMT